MTQRGGQLRATAVVSVLAAVVSGLVVPGLRGNAPEGTVVAVERLSQAVSGIAWLALLLAIVGGAIELSRAPRLPGWVRAGGVFGSSVVIALACVAFRSRLPTPLSLVLALASASVAVAAAIAAFRAAPTRAVGVVFAALAASAVVRLVAWELAFIAGEHANVALYGTARALATAGLALEGLGQLVATTWIGTRSRVAGQMLTLCAIAGAFVLTWGAAHGAHGGAPTWQTLAHTALADAPQVPAPYGLVAFATFLAPASLLLALVAAVQPRQLGLVVGPLALALVARGDYDVPLRALAVTAGGLWIVVVNADPRAVWSMLTEPSGGRPRDVPPREAPRAREG